MSFTSSDGVEAFSPPPDNMVGKLDFDNPQKTGQVPFFVTLSLGFILAALFFSQRLYTSVVIKKQLALDDCKPDFI